MPILINPRAPDCNFSYTGPVAYNQVIVVEISDKEFQALVSECIDAIPVKYQKHLGNVAFIIEDQPTKQQRLNLKLHPHETLFGLYEGVPLPQRGGNTKLLPDKITLFKYPLQSASRDKSQLKEMIRNTVWHEVAHFFGLDHLRINELER